MNAIPVGIFFFSFLRKVLVFFFAFQHLIPLTHFLCRSSGEFLAKALKERGRLVLITKGDLVHQTHKITTSGLAHHFDHLEIVLEKQRRLNEAIALADHARTLADEVRHATAEIFERERETLNKLAAQVEGAKVSKTALPQRTAYVEALMGPWAPLAKEARTPIKALCDETLALAGRK